MSHSTIPDILRRMRERELERQAAPIVESPYSPDSIHPPIANPLQSEPISASTSGWIVVGIVAMAVLGAGLLWLGTR